MVMADINNVSFHTDADVSVPVLSHGLNIIRNHIELRKPALVNNQITFRPEEFEQVLGVRRLSGVTITRLPDFDEGVLTLGGAAILAGQTIARENIQHIRLVPYPDRLGFIQFYFRDSESPEGYAISCVISVLDSINLAPTAEPVSINTQRNLPVFSRMLATDPEGDALEFRIINAPRRGLLEVRDGGAFVYRPNEGFTGRDRFIYKVRDEHGNWSNEATVNIRITRAASSVRFTDMDNHWAANSAVRAVAAGFIDVCESLEFNPSELMTRAEFTQMAVRAAGLVHNMPESINTGFADDADIPADYHNYINQARELGIINGIVRETGVYFEPNSDITRAEAAVILNNILQIPALSVATSRPAFADSVLIPVWAERDIAVLNANGILNGDQNNNFNPYGLINRAQSVEMLGNMREYTESQRSQQRWWRRLFG